MLTANIQSYKKKNPLKPHSGFKFHHYIEKKEKNALCVKCKSITNVPLFVVSPFYPRKGAQEQQMANRV